MYTGIETGFHDDIGVEPTQTTDWNNVTEWDSSPADVGVTEVEFPAGEGEGVGDVVVSLFENISNFF